MLICALAASFFLIIYRYDNKYTRPGPRAVNGVLVLDEHLLEEYPVLYLIDGWEYYADRLLSPEDFREQPPLPDQYLFIGRYGGFEAGDRDRSPHGCASYRLNIRLPELPRTYMMELPEIFSAYRLYVNGRLAMEMGNPDAAQYRPETGNRTVAIEARGNLEILLAVADYSHLYSGMVYPPAFGSPNDVALLLNRRLTFRAVICAAALTVGLLSALAGIFSRRLHPAALYSLLCAFFIGYAYYPIAHTLGCGLPLQYAMENLSFCAMLFVVMLLTRHVCQVRQGWLLIVPLFGFAVCLICAALPVLLPTSSLVVMRGYSVLVTVYEWSAAVYLSVTVAAPVWREDGRGKPLLCGILVFDCALVVDRLLPFFEPVVAGWFIELASFILVLSVGVMIAQEVAERYQTAAVLVERENSVMRLYQTQQGYVASLQQGIEEAGRLRHDVRHHFTMMDAFLQNGQYDQLGAYISEYQAAFPEQELAEYCPIAVINILAHHYIALAQRNQIRFDLRCDLGDADWSSIAVADADLCSLFSNLVENAIEACQRMDVSRREIRISIVHTGAGHLLIRIQNSTDHKVIPTRDTFLSAKEEGRKGFGLASIRAIARKYSGDASFHWNCEFPLFESRVFLLALQHHEQG